MTEEEKRDIALKLYREGRLNDINVHVIRETGPEMWNTDFSGRHKTINMGGVTRGRISSQALKFPARQLLQGEEACHTRHLGMQISDFAKSEGHPFNEWENQIMTNLISTIKGGKSNGTTSQIMYIDQYDLADVAAAIHKAAADISPDQENALDAAQKQIDADLEKSAITRQITMSTAFFGRMSTDQRFGLSVDSALAMAHAFTTNRWAGDTDDFVATDEAYINKSAVFRTADAAATGASFLLSRDVGSNVYYEFFTISMKTLFENVLDHTQGEPDIDKLIEKCQAYVLRAIEALLITTPGGKNTSMYSQVPPIAVYLSTAHEQTNFNATNEFHRPIDATADKSTADITIDRLKDFIDIQENGSYAKKARQTSRFWISDNYTAPDGVKQITLEDLNEIFQ